MEEELQEQAHQMFDEKLEKLKENFIVTENEAHVLRTLYGYYLSIKSQKIEDDNEDLLKLEDKIKKELKKYGLIPSAKKVERKVKRKEMSI